MLEGDRKWKRRMSVEGRKVCRGRISKKVGLMDLGREKVEETMIDERIEGGKKTGRKECRREERRVE